MIQITDIDFCDSEVSDEDFLEINGGGGFTWRGFNRSINRVIRDIGQAFNNSGSSVTVGYSSSGGWEYGIRPYDIRPNDLWM
jgi:hypothetical protein